MDKKVVKQITADTSGNLHPISETLNEAKKEHDERCIFSVKLFLTLCLAITTLLTLIESKGVADFGQAIGIYYFLMGLSALSGWFLLLSRIKHTRKIVQSVEKPLLVTDSQKHIKSIKAIDEYGRLYVDAAELRLYDYFFESETEKILIAQQIFLYAAITSLIVLKPAEPPSPVCTNATSIQKVEKKQEPSL